MRRESVSFFIALAALIAVCESAKTVHIVFSNHLDVGFNAQQESSVGTDDAVLNLYFHKHFNNAAWLISMYFDCPTGMGIRCPSTQAKQDLEAAIRKGEVYWHGLPFNAQTELYNRQLFSMTMFLVHQLDDRFNVTRKRVASLRDVPGLTRAAIQPMNEAGLVALTQGVNTASAPPGIPKNTPVHWKDPISGASILLWIHPGGYSGFPQDSPEECVQIQDFEHVLCSAWKEDNEGPHTFDEASKIFRYYEEKFPDSRIQSSTFEEYYSELEKAVPRLHLPIITEEIGDSWIYGVSSDYWKVSRYLATLRMWTAQSWRYDQYAFQNASRFLMKVGEHTWGIDVKSTIKDTSNWANSDFHEQLRVRAPNFEAAVHSWRRQANYVDWALEALGLSPEVLEEMAPRDLKLPGERWASQQGSEPSLKLDTDHWQASVNPQTGSIVQLQHRGRGGTKGVVWATEKFPLAKLTYNTYTESDYNVIWGNYTYAGGGAEGWPGLDFGKRKCSAAKPQHASYTATAVEHSVEVDESGGRILLLSEFPRESWEDAGAPQYVRTAVYNSNSDNSLHIDISIFLKTATRLPEAMWLKFQPDVGVADSASWVMDKLGQLISPKDVMLNGSQSQHAVGQGGVSITSHSLNRARRETLTIRSLDTLLVSPGKATPFPVGNLKPDLEQGMAYNLFNNIWGTNYVQWQPYTEAGVNATFRFVLQSSAATANE